MRSQDDPEGYRLALEAKLQPERIRATLGFAGLYQMTHELIKAAVLDEVRGFYWRGIQDGVIVYDEKRYAAEVLAKVPESKFRGLVALAGRRRGDHAGAGGPAG